MKNIFSIILIGGLLASCGGSTESAQTEKSSPSEHIIQLSERQLANAGVELGQFKKQPIASLLRVNGKIDVPPQNTISVSAPLGGYLKSTKLLPGMEVKKGEVIAILEDVQYIQVQQDYLSSKAQFALSESEYNRQKELNLSKSTSDKQFEQAKANYQMQLASLKALEQKLLLIGLNPAGVNPNTISRSISIKSPIAGSVAAVNVNTGKYLNPSDILFELVDPTSIYLSLSVFEKDVNKLKIGQSIIAYTNSDASKHFDCEIEFISKKLSGNSASEVQCRFKKYDSDLLPGMFMNAEIEVNRDEASTLPDEAIVLYAGKNYIFISKGSNQFEMKAVQLGDSEKGYTEILDAAQFEGKEIAIKGAYNLLMALKNVSED